MEKQSIVFQSGALVSTKVCVVAGLHRKGLKWMQIPLGCNPKGSENEASVSDSEGGQGCVCAVQPDPQWCPKGLV